MKAADHRDKPTGDSGNRPPEGDRGVGDTRPIEAVRPPRPFGLAAGEFVVPDDFDDPLPDDLLDAFEGRSDS